MNYRVLTEADLETVYPKMENDLKINHDGEIINYIKLYNAYRELFTEYIEKKLELKKYDEKIIKSKLNFHRIQSENMDIYQYFSCEVLKYIYVRNNIHIERLTKEDKIFLELQSGNVKLNKETITFVERTYEKIIFEDILKSGEICMIQYGPNSSNFFARNDAVVIGIRYDKFVEQEINNNWDRSNEKQREFLFELMQEMNKEFKEKLKVPVVVIEYDDLSVKYRI